MKASSLAAIVCDLLDSYDDDTTINPETGVALKGEGIILIEPFGDLTMSYSRKPGRRIVEVWINDHFIPSVMDGEPGHYRNHQGGTGYGLPVHPGSRILIEYTPVGFTLRIVYVRPH